MNNSNQSNEISDSAGDRRLQASSRDRRRREQRPTSPRRDGGDQSDENNVRRTDRRKRREADRIQRKVRRSSSRDHDDVGWNRPPSSSARGGGKRDGIDDLVLRNREAVDRKSGNRSVSSHGRRSSKKAAIASGHDIDSVLAQFRDQCDIHVATLLELKNNMTTSEKEVAVNAEKDKEFQQIRGWYDALAEKHAKLQQEHQELQAEHVALQQKYMSLTGGGQVSATAAEDLNGSFVMEGRIEGIGSTANMIDKAKLLKKEKKEKKKKDKKEKKSAVAIVWSRGK